ncbi:MAG: tRNA-dihydrouridine synthase family protein [Verrucomicrobiota bacterium]
MMSLNICDFITNKRPVLLLAPMQDVTDLPFWRVMHRYGGPDIYFTEYFRVYPNSRPEKHILECVRKNPSNKPVLAQMIGRDIPSLLRTAEALQGENILGLDLNLGCPAPIVCKKSSGGGMLREKEHLLEVLEVLREAITGNFTIKTRIGFYDENEFDELLGIFSQVPVDAVTVHGRTVKEMYRANVHYDRITQAVRVMSTRSIPVFANGNVLSAHIAKRVAQDTGAAGLMIGRGCIRNPWIWDQIKELYEFGEVQTQPTLRDLREYIDCLYKETTPIHLPEKVKVAKMKKYMNFIAQGIGPEESFLFEIRRVNSEKEFFNCCDRWLMEKEFFQPEMHGGALVNSGNPRNDCY